MTLTHTVNGYDVRQKAIVLLDHAIARIGAWDAQGWLTNECDHDAVFTLQHAKWSLEAMNSVASMNSRFWAHERQEYDAILEVL